MDAYEATRVVMGRIQAVDPENAAKIMGLLLLQDHGEKEMIRLAFGPEPLLLSVVQKAHKELGLATPPAPSTPSAAAASPFLLARQNSSSRLLGNSPPSWAPLPENPDELLSPSNTSVPSPFYGGGGDLIDELQLQEQLAFLNDGHGPHLDRRSLSGAAEGAAPFSCNLMGWTNGLHRRSCSAAELAEAAGYGWRPCLYFARGYCKNGTSCRFLHGLPDDPAAASPLAGGNMDSVVERQCHELLLRPTSQRLMASAGAGAVLPYSPTGSIPPFTSSSQKVAAAAAALMLGGDDAAHKFMVRSPRMERSDLAALANPGSRQIYLTFPADSTFREEDVSNYFSIYGPVQDVRIPYQQKRMFGFVTFVYPETVKLILAKGNPHFVCDARVLVKPYKEKGKVPDKYRKQQQQAERVDFSGCTTPTGLVDAREAYDLQQLVSSGAARMLYGGGLSQEALLRKRLEEQLHAVELQQAIELQNRRFMGLQLLDLKSGRLNSSTISTPTNVVISSNNQSNASQEEAAPLVEVKSQGTAAPAAAAPLSQATVDAGADKEESTGETNPNEDTGFQESAEHNLPDSPFASPTKSSFKVVAFSNEAELENTVAAPPHNNGSHLMATSSLLPPTSTLDKASFECCFFQVPRFASGRGAVGM